MDLYINGQDIKRLVLGLGDIKNHSTKVFDVAPEDFLKSIISYLDEAKLEFGDIKKLYIVKGPGSATALRTSLAIVNTLHFTKKIEIIGIEKGVQILDQEFFGELLLGDHKEEDMIMPVYSHEPRITISTKDNLKQ